MATSREGKIVVPAKAKCFLPLLPYQQEDVESNDRFRWCCWSRQTGKSFTKSLRRVLRGIVRRRTQIFLSAGERQSRELMAKARQHCQVLKIATEMFDCDYFLGSSFRQLELRLPGGVRIIGLPANPQTARGFSGDLFLDEFAMHAEDREIWAAMFPTLLRGDGELDVASTPKGIKNVFARLRENPEFGHSTVTLPDAVAQGLDVDVDQLRRSMGDEQLFRQEFLCEFIDGSTAFLTLEQISACEDAELDRNTPLSVLKAEMEDLFVGVDIGRRHDLTVVWVVARRGNRFVTRRVIEMRGETFRNQAKQIHEVLSLRNVRKCCFDAGGLGMQLSEAAQEDFGRHKVEGLMFTVALKAELASRLRIAVEDQAIRIPADESIRNDWHSVERRVSPSGRIVLESSRREGHHADRFWAAALALHAASDDPGLVESMTVRPLRYDRKGMW